MGRFSGRYFISSCFVVATLIGVCGFQLLAQDKPPQSNKESKKATAQGRSVAAGRREVKMLDDIYKGSIVTITSNYVNDKQTIPAGTAFKQLFVAAEKKGWHRVRLLDVTGEPYNDENVAEDAFEKRAVKQLAAGKQWVEQVEMRQGRRHLRVATPIPVVFKKCVMCHENYADVPKGHAIGALTYIVPLDGKLVSKLAGKKNEK